MCNVLPLGLCLSLFSEKLFYESASLTRILKTCEYKGGNICTPSNSIPFRRGSDLSRLLQQIWHRLGRFKQLFFIVVRVGRFKIKARTHPFCGEGPPPLGWYGHLLIISSCSRGKLLHLNVPLTGCWPHSWGLHQDRVANQSLISHSIWGVRIPVYECGGQGPQTCSP